MTAIIACVLFTLFGGCIWNFLFYSIYSVSIENETIKACLGLFHVPTYKRAKVCFLGTYPGWWWANLACVLKNLVMFRIDDGHCLFYCTGVFRVLGLL